ncbi:MAG: ATP-binding protein [Prevotella sp.]|nr:ATP-binding protein [Prevotella sp.]
MKKYPIGIQSFEKIRTEGFFYIDKTRHIYDMATAGRYYFLSRPRRFGKSLLISTMEAYFSGQRHLFEGLDIEKTEQEWTEYPVLHLDLNTGKYDTEEELTNRLDKTLRSWESIYGMPESGNSIYFRFEDIVQRAAEKTGKHVVILIDEYDKPLLQAIGNEELQEKYRSMLKAFYSVLKTQDRYIRFAFLTGVTKFGKVSVFSDLNNLDDISMDERYADICGITEEEIRQDFDVEVASLAEKHKLTKEECYGRLQQMYDGYHFEHGTVGLYNPFSLLNTFSKMKFGNYWVETGTPSFLVKLLRQADYRLDRLTEDLMTSDLLNCIDQASGNPIPVIYQSGYLTIKSYNEEFGTYTLDFPNKEVKDGFMRFLMPYYTPAQQGQGEFFIQNFVKDIRSGNAEGFMLRMQTLFASGDYRIAGNMELYFQNAMYVIFKLIGFHVDVERPTANGRIDIIMKTKDYIYIIELKLDGSADEALRQIEDRGYAKPYALDGRRIFRIGVNFSSETRGIKEWKIGK